jgi:alpha-tubulin suppressor-like RCC1 family protein
MGVVTTTGQVWTWGYGGLGALGHGQFDDNDYEDDATMEGTVANSFVPVRVLELPGREDAHAVSVSCGASFSLVGLQTGEVCRFGEGIDGQLGLPQIAQLAELDQETLSQVVTWTSVPRVVCCET